VEVIGQWAPGAVRILEVGCGEGAMTERLCARYPEARITAIDLTPRLGRLFRGDAERVRFIQAPAEQIAASEPASFDLIILSDVLHHVPTHLRESLMQGIGRALAPKGIFAFKDWVVDRSLIHWACEASDRYITGDNVAYLTGPEMRDLLARHFGPAALLREQRVRPWNNNLAVLVSQSA
jgi:2-polyprenyl-6-hydroxyphenyl methylase/3-demethylubiquinone-9 3-methyltransferase